MAEPVRELGCSKCRYSILGCARCKHPGFQPRTQAPISELRSSAAATRSQHSSHNKTSKTINKSTQPQNLKDRLSHHLREEERPEPEQQRPSKYRRIEATQPPATLLETTKGGHKRRRSPRPQEDEPVSKQHKSKISSSPQDQQMMDIEEDSSDAVDNETMEVDEELNSPPLQKRQTSEDFLEKLQSTIEQRRRKRLSGEGAEELDATRKNLLLGRQPKRRKVSTEKTCPKSASPSSGNSAEEEEEVNREDVNPRSVLWDPPVSPYGLIEEELYNDPWKLLVACMLLNKTTGSQVRKIIWEFFSMCPSAEEASKIENVAAIERLIEPLGLFRKRAVAIQRFSEEYLEKDWRDPRELYGIGKYAADAYFMFCRGRWRDIEPEDKDLKNYHRFLMETDGLGRGLQRI